LQARFILSTRNQDAIPSTVRPIDVAVSVAVGVLAAAALSSVYVVLVTLAQGFTHAGELLLDDWYFVSAISVGFGVQAGLFWCVRRIMTLRRSGSAGALAATGTSTSTAAMLACCAHHVTDALPVLGLSGAAIFVNDYRLPLMLAGLAVNAAGIAFMTRMLLRERRSLRQEVETCFVASS
jgi:hypothetical protein